MPRNNDGKVVKVMNWVDEDQNNRSFTGTKLENDTRDLADIIQDCLDVQGRNVMQNSLRLENNRAIDAADPYCRARPCKLTKYASLCFKRCFSN